MSSQQQRSPELEALLQEIDQLHQAAQLPEKKHAIIGKIVGGRFRLDEQIDLRRHLQSKLFAPARASRKSKLLSELQQAEEDLRRQCQLSNVNTDKLVDSDSKLGRIKRSQETIAQEIIKTRHLIRRKKKLEFREEMYLIGALVVFLAVCAYVVLDRLGLL